jgi:hypothetical protein
MAIEVYKIVHKESPSYLHDLLVIKIKDTKYCFRYDNITEIPSVWTTRYGLKSFRYAAAKRKIFMYFLKHTLKHILKIFQEYFKNI